MICEAKSVGAGGDSAEREGRGAEKRGWGELSRFLCPHLAALELTTCLMSESVLQALPESNSLLVHSSSHFHPITGQFSKGPISVLRSDVSF